MKFKKVIFVRYLPLTKKISEDFYFQDLITNGVEVEYWDVSFILPGVSNIEDYQCDVVKRFSSYRDISCAVKVVEKDSSLFVLIMTYNGDILRLYSILSRNKCTLSVFGKNTFPLATFSKTAVLSSSNLSFKLVRKLYLNKLSVWAKKYHIVKPYDVLFLAGRNGVQGIGRVTQEEKSKSLVVNINSDDYDRMIAKDVLSENNHLTNHNNFAIFLDEYLPLHQDLELTGLKPINANLYYSALNHFFDLIESHYGVKVIIAAHPKAIRYKKEDFFEGRNIIWNKTAELCKDCDFVLAHDSTSINFAVMFEKPIISLISDDIIKTSPVIADSIKAFSDYLRTPIINIDNPDLNNLKLEVDIESYSKYKYDFLTSPESENRRTVDILIDFLHSDK